MGCFSLRASYSNLPIDCGDKVVVIVGLVKNYGPAHKFDHFSPGTSFSPLTFPIRGTYNDYGSLNNIERDETTEQLEKFFGMSVDDLVRVAERANLGAERQVADELKNIKRVISESTGRLGVEAQIEKYNLTYVMEHESVFDQILNIGDTSLYDHEFEYRGIPRKYIEALGYKRVKTMYTHKDEYGYKIYTYEKDGYPSLTVHGEQSTRLMRDKDDWNNHIHSIKKLCEKTGVTPPEEWKTTSYFKYRFLEDCELSKIIKKKIAHTPLYSWWDAKSDFIDNSTYSFINTTSGHGLFTYSEYRNTDFILAPYVENSFKDSTYSYLDAKYADGFAAIASLMNGMKILGLTWGSVGNNGQDIEIDAHVTFSECILGVAKEKAKEWHDEWDEEYDEEYDEEDGDSEKEIV